MWARSVRATLPDVSPRREASGAQASTASPSDAVRAVWVPPVRVPQALVRPVPAPRALVRPVPVLPGLARPVRVPQALVRPVPVLLVLLVLVVLVACSYLLLESLWVCAGDSPPALFRNRFRYQTPSMACSRPERIASVKAW